MGNVWKALAGLVALAALLAPATSAADSIGTAGAANVTSSGTPPGGAVRVIEIGAQIVQNEKIETSPTGSVQILFIDKTTLNIGPNSRLVIDRFAFDPAASQGQMALTLTKGVLRIVGGQVTHTGGATVETPAASIGVRGAIVTIAQDGKHGTRAFLGYGQLTFTSRCAPSDVSCEPKTVTLSRPGFMVASAGVGAEPSAPVRASADQVAAVNQQTTSAPGQTGGASTLPTDQEAAANNIGTETSTVATVPAPPIGRGGGALAVAAALSERDNGCHDRRADAPRR